MGSSPRYGRTISQADKTANAQIGKKVRARRLEIGMSQEKVGRQVGVSFQQIQKYESGANRISASMLQELAKALQTDVTQFVAGNGNSGKPGFTEFLATKDGADLIRAAVTLDHDSIRSLIMMARRLSKTKKGQE